MKEIRIGNQTAFSASSVMEPFEYAVLNGFDAFEWFPDRKEDGQGWDDLSIGNELRGYIRQTAREHDIMLTVHVPWNADSSTPQGRDLLLRNVAFASDIGAALVNIHFTSPQDAEGFLTDLEEVIRATAEHKLLLSIENTVTTGPDDFNALFRRIGDAHDLPTGHLGMCLDIGHANLCSKTRNDYLGFMDRLDPSIPIRHVHLHENYGDADRHLPLFTGPSSRDISGVRGVIRRLLTRNYRGAMILEQWPYPHELLTQARDRLLGLLDEEGMAGAAAATLSGRSPAARADEEVFLGALVTAHSAARSWREKLQWVRATLSAPVSKEQLLYLAVYLRLLSLGILPVQEDGGHHRPNHLARVALDIDAQLRALSSQHDPFILRKIRPYLPSGDPAYQRAEPLTRIRDIAHRNDIPKDLKHEIKHTLQNKLHRCAGPEDMLTASRLLAKITERENDYSPAFVAEFRLFHQELQEFFNAHALQERLAKTMPLLTEGTAGLVRQFIAATKESSDPFSILALLTDVRGRIAFEAAVREGWQAQQSFLADAGLEDYAFSLLSGIATAMDHGEWKAQEWARALSSVSLALRNLAMGSVEPEECGAVAAEIVTLHESVNPSDREHILMVNALCGRVLRLSEGYAEKMLGLFATRAERLGRALGVAQEDLRYYIENDVREHIVFPLSRIAVSLAREARRVLGLPPWDPVVPGSCVGRLAFVRRIGDAPSPVKGETQVLVVEEVEGDEDVPPGVTGVILRHQLPHLCHFCVRARQQGTVVVVCEDWAGCGGIPVPAGTRVSLRVTADAVDIARCDVEVTGGAKKDVGMSYAFADTVIDLSTDPPVLDLDDVPASRGGAKAYAIRKLRDLAKMGDAGFLVPDGMVIPFGVMDRAFALRPAIQKRYLKRIGQIKELEGKGLNAASEDVRRLVCGIDVPQEVVAAIRDRFAPGLPLIVRSSAFDEDRHYIAGAGIYASVANVRAEELQKAILTVWASLWSPAAVSQRRLSNFPFDRVRMAVLVQPVVMPDLSFILHSANPLNGSHGELYAELAPGHGEIIASSIHKGTPYRMVCDKDTGRCRMTAFSNFSTMLVAGARGLEPRIADYSLQKMHIDIRFRAWIGQRLVGVGRTIEEAFGGPQDIEGGFAGEAMYLFQTRPQEGLGRQ